MKRKFTIWHWFLVAPFALLSTASAQQANRGNLAEYNNFIVAEHRKVSDKVYDYVVESVHQHKEGDIFNMRNQIVSQIDASITRLKALPVVRGDRKYRTEAIEILELLKETFTREYQQIEKLKQSRESSFEAMESFFKAEAKAAHKIKKLNDKFRQAQIDFAGRYNMLLVVHEAEDPLTVISAVNQYNHQLFLEFFRIAKLNSTLLTQLESSKLSKASDTRQELLVACQTAMTTIAALPGYQGDPAYKNKTLQTIAVIRKLAEKEYSEIIVMKRQGNDLVDSQADRYNEIIALINDQVPALMHDFNQTKHTFFQKYIPQKQYSW